MADQNVRVTLPRKLAFLFEPHRYKAMHSGRGAGKSWGVARTLLIMGMQRTLRVMCTREFQSSMKDSVHKLLSDQVRELGLQDHYQILKDTIRGVNGTEFIFRGLRDPDALRSAEGCDIAWIEEARTVSKASFDILIPTIRKPGSEIWLTWNPELDDDEVHKRFILNPPPTAKVVGLSWRDNPWFPEELRLEMEHLKETDYDAYLTVWEGKCRQSLDGAVYANEIRNATAQDRIRSVPIMPERPVYTFWDLGRGDMTAIWFAQIVGGEYHLPLYYQANGFSLDHYLDVLLSTQVEHKITYGTVWLPHDADHRLLGSRRTIREQVQDAGYKVKIVPKVPVHEGINAARSIFPKCWFDAKGAADGLNCLRRYRYDVADDGTRSRAPVHDAYSHGADGFRYMGVALRDEPPPKARPKPKLLPKVTGRTAWLGG